MWARPSRASSEQAWSSSRYGCVAALPRAPLQIRVTHPSAPAEAPIAARARCTRFCLSRQTTPKASTEVLREHYIEHAQRKFYQVTHTHTHIHVHVCMYVCMYE
jgi:hypothetical protein